MKELLILNVKFFKMNYKLKNHKVEDYNKVFTVQHIIQQYHQQQILIIIPLTITLLNLQQELLIIIDSLELKIVTIIFKIIIIHQHIIIHFKDIHNK